ncbi:Sec-independent protein translocase TatB [Amycolatopsis sp. PS_44_ISF1]|uniref:Sec-independent protein translocase TatB n=1 Tax=Amycolatopsis sp. PS_44_ISF1 TaxID=2974917 RepID=UPI0028DFAE48|nr:Sec-independent protein translocase TatB [Amycolatopsis sp. PS_44_ISF1]MDT8912032.1 Sec-independent protein translocase TatB [Amycolatopsis sp. PS_44_ISF1]
MFGLSAEHLLVLLVAGLFIIGPERLPGAMTWLTGTLRKARAVVGSARDQLGTELGPEFEQLRKPLQDLRALRKADPRVAMSRFLLEDEPAARPPRPTQPAPGTTAGVDLEAT